VGGSTNTLAAFSLAFVDPFVQGIYFVSDGRPDQEESKIIDFLQTEQQKRKFHVNTLSFGCVDPEANAFLLEIAETTNGTFQYFIEDLDDTIYESEEQFAMIGPLPIESIDCFLIREEITKANTQLHLLRQLWDEIQYNEKQRSVSVQRGTPPNYMYELTCPPSAIPERKPRHNEPEASLPLQRYDAEGRPVWNKDSRFKPPSVADTYSRLSKLIDTILHEKQAKSQEQEQSIDIPSSEWLQTHSLDALQLSFASVIRQASIPAQTARDIAILDKSVVGKVDVTFSFFRLKLL
jgi:hypothetical protein